jgi:hypothetical protein
LELRAHTSLVRSGGAQSRTGELLARVAELLEQITLTPDSADVREARALLLASRSNPKSARDIPSITAK